MDQYSISSSQQTVGQFRQIFPQIIATSANALLFLSLGMLVGFPTVLIPVLTDKTTEGQPHFTVEEASWYGSVSYVFQPIGSVVAGAFLQSLGCKRLMILLNIPLFACWLMTYFATSNLILYVAHAFVGCVLGLMEGPGLRYVIEISHPSIRGVLTTCTTLFVSLGFLSIIFLGSVTSWRDVALISSAIPVLCILILFQIPETPMWLMSKGRPQEALHSLQWLRGWTSPEMVQDEFAKLEFYAKKKTLKVLHAYGKEVDTRNEQPANTKTTNNNTVECSDPGGDATNNGRFTVDLTVGTGSDGSDPRGHTLKDESPRVSFQVEEGYAKRGFVEKWRDVTRREMLVPLSKCCALFAFLCFGGMPPLRPYLVTISQKLNTPVQPNWSSVLVALLGILGNVGCMLMIKRVGKKPLLIFSLACAALCLGFLALFLMGFAPAADTLVGHWWPLILFLALFFFYNLGAHPITWLYLGEILPYRGRGVATSIAVSVYYLVTFVAVKTFSTLEQELNLHGVFFVYAAVCVGGIFFTFFLPETEGRFLSDIETEITQGKDSERDGS